MRTSPERPSEPFSFTTRWHGAASRRIRLDMRGLKGDEPLARSVEAHFARVPWVIEVKADVDTGRVLLRYAGDAPPLDHVAPPSFLARRAAEALRLVPQGMIERAAGLATWARDKLRRPARTATAEVLFAAPPWHARPTDEVVRALGCDLERGLTTEEARGRLASHGANALEAQPARSRLTVLVAQVANLPTGLLLVAAGVSLAVGDLFEAGAIILVVMLNTAIGYRIERKSERLIEAWRRLDAGAATVTRAGATRQIATVDLVPGDLLVLRAGDLVPADARVIEAQSLACAEAALTGEAEPQTKQPDAVDEGAPLAERGSMVFAGTGVTAGRGRALVVATGARTEVARIRQLVSETEQGDTPLERQLASLGRRATGVGLGAAAAMLVIGLVHRRPFGALLRSSVALGIAAIPEGLPVTATAALVRSIHRLRARGMVVRKLASAETLGGVTVVCIDKTGTITANEMCVDALCVDGRAVALADARPPRRDPLRHRPTLLLAAAVLNSDVDVGAGGNGLAGSGTERALVTAAYEAGLDLPALRAAFPRRRLHERTNGTNYVVSVHDGPEGPVAFVKGAPEQVLALCATDGMGPLTDDRRRAALRANEEMAAHGRRVLAVAWRRHARGPNRAARDWELVGLVGLVDPVRAGAPEAVRVAERAGIRTLILTGDQAATAAAVARDLGLRGETLEGATLMPALQAGDRDALDRLERAAALARVTPADKLTVVKALKARGAVVAMAGDGINDAPALKSADVGIAVGSGATDVARQTADIVLEGADLRTILAAVGEGRIVQDNLRRAVRFLFATNLSEVALMLAGALVRREPLTAMQLLWVNLVTDTLPALALALEPGDPNVLARPPARPGSPLLDRQQLLRLGRDGAALGGVGAVAFILGGNAPGLAALTGAQLAYTLVCRARDAPAHRRFGLLLGSGVALQAGALLLPPLRGALGVAGSIPVALAALAAGFFAPLVVAGGHLAATAPTLERGAVP